MTASKDRIIGRIMALTLFTIAAAVSIRGMSTTTSAPGEHANVVCGALGCSGNNPGHVKGTGHGGGGGGGTTHLGG